MREPIALKPMGVTFIAFGDEADLLASHSVCYSRQHTDLPFQVITNTPENRRHAKWKEVSDVHFTYIAESIRFNRTVKCQLPTYTIFEKCLYCDIDAVIQNPGLDKALADFDGDLMLNYYDTYTADHILGIYYRAHKQFNCTLPLDVYNGAVFAFNRATAPAFFNMWFANYVAFGKKRDMPPLACTLQQYKQQGGVIQRFSSSVFAPNIFAIAVVDPNALIQHVVEDYDLIGTIGLPRMPRLQRYEGGTPPDDWKWVNSA